MAWIGLTLTYAISAYLFVLLARAVLSFFPLFIKDWTPRGIMLVVAETVYTLTDPPLRWISQFVKPIQVGNLSFDLGFIILYMGLTLLMRCVALLFL